MENPRLIREKCEFRFRGSLDFVQWGQAPKWAILGRELAEVELRRVNVRVRRVRRAVRRVKSALRRVNRCVRRVTTSGMLFLSKIKNASNRKDGIFGFGMDLL